MLVLRWVSAILFITSSHALCPKSEKMWKNKAVLFKCEVDLEYHCLRTSENVTKEICFHGLYIEARGCPLLDSGMMQLVPCEKKGCPTSPYLTHELYKYPVCFGDTKSLDVEENSSVGVSIREDLHQEQSTQTVEYLNFSTPYSEDVNNFEEQTTRLNHQNDTILRPIGLLIILVTSMVTNFFILVIVCVKSRNMGNKKKVIHEIHPEPITVPSDGQIYSIIPVF